MMNDNKCHIDKGRNPETNPRRSDLWSSALPLDRDVWPTCISSDLWFSALPLDRDVWPTCISSDLWSSALPLDRDVWPTCISSDLWFSALPLDRDVWPTCISSDLWSSALPLDRDVWPTCISSDLWSVPYLWIATSGLHVYPEFEFVGVLVYIVHLIGGHAWFVRLKAYTYQCYLHVFINTKPYWSKYHTPSLPHQSCSTQWLIQI